MATVSEYPAPTWPLARLRRHFDDIPAERILLRPRPGTATEANLIYLDDHEDRHCELIDGCLIEKVMGNLESRFTVVLIKALEIFIEERDLGQVLGPDAFVRLMPGLVRGPDFSFLSWETLGADELPNKAIGEIAPDLAVEVISRGNTRKEMQRKLAEYFDHGVRLVWLVYPTKKRVDVYRGPNKKKTVTRVLDGGDVLPGFKLLLSDLFSAHRRRKK